MTTWCSMASRAALLAALALSPLPALAQAADPADAAAIAAPRVEPGFKVPRLAIGQPDLQGVWSNASNTRLTRPAEFKKLTMTDEEYERAVAVHPQNVRQRTDDNQKLEDGLLDGKDLARGRGYNAFWIDPGTSYGNVKGTWRTSWIVDPPSGQIPYSAEGRKLQQEAARQGRKGNGYDNPEERSLGERCIIQPTPGPPLGQYLYNNMTRIIQSPGHVVVQTEMINDARVIPLVENRQAAALRPDAMKLWMGDSVGWWEGDTLVVETRNIRADQLRGYGVFLTKDGKITERFTRYNDRQVLYEFEVDDPKVYSQVWRAEMSLNDIGEDLYEYACHEGNYGLLNILAGGRTNDRRGVSNEDPEDNRSE
jgi:hypothetical protein